MPRLRLPKLMATSSNDLSGASSDAPVFFMSSVFFHLSTMMDMSG